MQITANRPTSWNSRNMLWLLLAVSVLLIGVLYYRSLLDLVHRWEVKQEYSHGYLIPFVSLFLLWLKKDRIEALTYKGSWAGVLLCIIALVLFFLGDLSTIFLVVHYSLVILIFALVLSCYGWPGIRVLWVPVLFLVFMIPLPPFLHNNISGQLQLLSSELGVAVIRAFGISVYLEGNVIDLGSMKLQVVEACNGLRYLFPLMSFGFLAAYFFNAPLWQRAIVFASSIPVTIVMNSFRIGVIGIMVEYWGVSMAEGFLHDFEGWLVFMLCTMILVGEIWMLNKIWGRGRQFKDAFKIEFPAATKKNLIETKTGTVMSAHVIVVIFILVMAVAVSFMVDNRKAYSPVRKNFTEFPLSIGEWHGKQNKLKDIYLESLKLSDYIIANYSSDAGETVNFYVAYYNSQRSGEAAHSPRSCIPGGGWKINKLSKVDVADVSYLGKPLSAYRLQIQKGDYRQLVYYWFQQRDRVLTSEYLVKWYLFWDALTRNRTDGALVRLTTLVPPGESWEKADERLARFASVITPVLNQYVPN